MRIIRHRVAVDDLVHVIPIPVGPDPYLQFACRTEDSVDFWVLDGPSIQVRDARLLVIGTGHMIGPEEKWVGTAVTPSQAFVWHVVEA